MSAGSGAASEIGAVIPRVLTGLEVPPAGEVASPGFHDVLAVTDEFQMLLMLPRLIRAFDRL